MTVEVSLLIAFFSLAFGIYQGVVNMKRNKSTDDRKDASEMTTVIVKLEGIGKDTGEIKNDVRGLKEEVKHNSEQLIRQDESLKSAWKRINAMDLKITAIDEELKKVTYHHVE